MAIDWLEEDCRPVAWVVVRGPATVELAIEVRVEMLELGRLAVKLQSLDVFRQVIALIIPNACDLRIEVMRWRSRHVVV